MIKEKNKIKNLQITKIFLHDYILPQFRSSFKDDLNNYITKTTKKLYFNYINFNDFADFIIEFYYKEIKKLIKQYKIIPNLKITVLFDKNLKEPYLDVFLGKDNNTIFSNKLYQFFTYKGLSYKTKTGKFYEFDKKYFEFLNNSSKTFKDFSYKQNLSQFYKNFTTNYLIQDQLIL